jgi:hypothetical protein
MVGIRLGIMIMIVVSRIIREIEEVAAVEVLVLEVVVITVENKVTFLGNVRIKTAAVVVEEALVLVEEVVVEVLEEDVLTVEKKDTFLGNALTQDLVMEVEVEEAIDPVQVEVVVAEVVVVVEVVVLEEEEVVVITVVNKATFLGNVQMQDHQMEVAVEETDLVVRAEVAVAVDVIEKVEAVVVILADRQDIFHESAHKQQEETEDRTRERVLVYYCFLKLFVRMRL